MEQNITNVSQEVKSNDKTGLTLAYRRVGV